MLRRLAEITPGDANADLAVVAEFGERGKGIRHVQWIMKIGHHDRGAQTNRHVRGDRSQHHHLVAVTNVVVDPDLREPRVGAELRQAHQVAHAVMIRQMGDELQAELAGEDLHNYLFMVAANWRRGDGKLNPYHEDAKDTKV